jgi:hypothetical protein
MEDGAAGKTLIVPASRPNSPRALKPRRSGLSSAHFCGKRENSSRFSGACHLNIFFWV